MSLFAEYAPTRIAPWLRDKWGKLWATALGLQFDAVANAYRAAVKARYARYAPTDGLQYVGFARAIERGPGESEASYRARLAKPFTRARTLGTDAAVLETLRVAGFPVARVYRNRDVSIDGSQAPGAWARFWVLVLEPHGVVPSLVWGVGQSWGGGRQ